MWRLPAPRKGQLAAALLILITAPGEARAVNAPSSLGQTLTSTPLQLEVWVNGAATDLIVPFSQHRDGRLFTQPSELRALGLRAPSTAGATEIALDSLAGVSARFDPRAQRLDITASVSALLPVVLHGRAERPRRVKAATPDLGALMNYSLFTGVVDERHGGWSTDGLAGQFETRVFGPFGRISNSFTTQVGTSHDGVVRLDSGWGWSDPQSLSTVRAGDLISGGFTWTRPLRMGGLQIRRDFGLRPDLITMPSPQFSASATVPSIADVLVNGVAVDSEAVRGGPLQVQDVAPVEGVNRAQLVLRDTLGRQTAYSTSFFVTPDLLKPGMMDFSAELGVARRNYGLRSLDYDRQPAASASLRTGLTDWATAEFHAEGDPHIAMAGAAGVFRFGGLGVGSLSLSGSDYRGQAGGQVGATLRAQLGPATFDGQAQQTFGRYFDLGAVTGDGIYSQASPRALAPPRQLVQAGVSVPLVWGGLQRGAAPYFGVNLAAVTPVVGIARAIASANLRQTFRGGLSVFLNTYADLRSQGRSQGGFLGVSLPFGGGRGTTDAGVQSDDGRVTAFAEAASQGGLEPGSVSWRMRAAGGADSDLAGEIAYRTGFAMADARVERQSGDIEAQLNVTGAVVLMDGSAFASNRIDNAFAVVSVGEPKVPVSFENRPVGVTDSQGRLLIPYLSANDRNVIAIDGDALPSNLIASSTRMVVTPARGAGVVVRFALRPAMQGLLVSLQNAAGRPLPVGAQGRITSTGARFVVGYDGLAYLEGVSAATQIEVALTNGTSCTARITSADTSRHPVRCV
jgi:outer membrane usher protein